MSARRAMFRAFRHRNFALFFAGQSLSMVGWWVQQIATGWLIYEMTGSALWLGLLAFASNVPVLLLSPLAGWWADHANRHWLMLASQVLEGLQALVLVALIASGWLEPWHLLLLGALLGSFVALELAVRQPYLLDLVGGKEDLPNAVTLTAVMGQAGRLIGPSIGGLLIAAAGPLACFALNACTYVLVVASLLMIRVPARRGGSGGATLLAGLAEGLRHAWRSYPIRTLLSTLAIVSLMAMPYQALMPAFVGLVYQGDARTLGFLVGASGLGALLAGLYLSGRPGIGGTLRLMTVALAVLGSALLLYSQSAWLPASLALMIVVGCSSVLTTLPINLIMQSLVDDDKRGRVMSLYTTLFLGVTPLGALALGALAEAFGPRIALAAGGTACVLGALRLAAVRRRLRREMKAVLEPIGAALP
jgi:MFS family permease